MFFTPHFAAGMSWRSISDVRCVRVICSIFFLAPRFAVSFFPRADGWTAVKNQNLPGLISCATHRRFVLTEAKRGVVRSLFRSSD